MNNRIKTLSISILHALLVVTFTLAVFTTQAAQYRVLFLGNSYTQVNDLPSLIKNLALSTGDQMIYSVNTPGGYSFQQHSTDAVSIALIKQGNWDYVVLQEQSQRPAFPDTR